MLRVVLGSGVSTSSDVVQQYCADGTIANTCTTSGGGDDKAEDGGFLPFLGLKSYGLVINILMCVGALVVVIGFIVICWRCCCYESKKIDKRPDAAKPDSFAVIAGAPATDTNPSGAVHIPMERLL